MSIAALNWAFTRPMTDAAAKAVLVALADHVGEDGRCWPSIARICLMTALAERTVQMAEKRLAEMGAVRIEIRAGRANIITLNFNWTGQSTPAGDAPPQKLHPAAAAPPPPQEMHPTPAAAAPAPAAAAPEPSISTIEPSGEPSSGAQARATAKEAANGSRRIREERGTRLDPAWLPSPEDRAYAESLGLNPDITGEEFRNFWIGVPGARGRKLDWPATFRNRCIQLAGATRRGPNGHAGGNGSGFQESGSGLVAAARRVARRRGLVLS